MFDFRKYELSASHGYIPQQRPASTLPASHAVYEDLMHDPELHIAIQSHELRVKVDTLPNLNVANLGPAHKRRAYTLLSFVAHGYIWGNGTKTLSELPSQISEPLEYLSGEYGVHALGTYASTVLWNCWSELPLEEWKVENISASFTFTGSKDEEYFYAISALIEAHGAASLRSIVHILQSVQQGSQNAESMMEHFNEIHCSLEKMVTDIQWINAKRISPHGFFWKLRPYFAGWDHVEPDGVSYLHSDGPARKYHGISAAQSSLFPTLDIFFGISHEKRPLNYLRKMRSYMPSGHRSFLEYIEDLRMQNRSNLEQLFAEEEVQARVQSCRKLLARFRGIHLQLAKNYAVKEAKRENQVSFGLAKSFQVGGGVLGAGGTELVPFLTSLIQSTDPNAAQLPPADKIRVD